MKSMWKGRAMAGKLKRHFNIADEAAHLIRKMDGWLSLRRDPCTTYAVRLDHVGPRCPKVPSSYLLVFPRQWPPRDKEEGSSTGLAHPRLIDTVMAPQRWKSRAVTIDSRVRSLMTLDCYSSSIAIDASPRASRCVKSVSPWRYSWGGGPLLDGFC